jgi:hypothetical protein
LTRLKAAIGLVDDVDPALTPHDAVVAVAAAQGLQGIADFHDNLCFLDRSSLVGGFIAAHPPLSTQDIHRADARTGDNYEENQEDNGALDIDHRC